MTNEIKTVSKLYKTVCLILVNLRWSAGWAPIAAAPSAVTSKYGSGTKECPILRAIKPRTNKVAAEVNLDLVCRSQANSAPVSIKVTRIDRVMAIEALDQVAGLINRTSTSAIADPAMKMLK